MTWFSNPRVQNPITLPSLKQHNPLLQLLNICSNDLGRTALFFVHKIQWRIQARGPLLFLDQTEARRAEKFFWRPPPVLSKGLDDRPHPYLKVWIPH